MAAVIGDFIPESSRFHAMIANPPLQHHHSHHAHHPHQHPHDAAPYRSSSRPRQTSTPRPHRSASATTAATIESQTETEADTEAVNKRSVESVEGTANAASRIPSPPPSSSPAVATSPTATDNENSASMASDMITAPVAASHASASSTSSSTRRLQQPSPASDDFQIPNSAATPRSAPAQPTVIHVRDLAHIKSLAQTDILAGGGASLLGDTPLQQFKYDISAMPIGDVIEMVAALLTKITTTNDLQHDAMQRNAAHQQQANQSSESPGSSHMSPISHSVLAFHGKNVPAITILSYLSRIHKYCPTTFEVFLSLLVYFDRMTERVNDLVTKSEEVRKKATQPSADVTMRGTDSANNQDESDSDLADDDDEEMTGSGRREANKVITVPEELPSVNGPSTYFVVDSFNIHRLIISGVTCSSKFFSDVFYTNSRYAKVGGLPLPELNHLELQFLVLNDFRLAIPVEDLEAYATMLVEFYAREVVSQKS